VICIMRGQLVRVDTFEVLNICDENTLKIFHCHVVCESRVFRKFLLFIREGFRTALVVRPWLSCPYLRKAIFSKAGNCREPMAFFDIQHDT